MSCFYYWLPEVAPSIKLEEICTKGLGYALEDKHTARGCNNGPDGSHGSVVCHGDNRDGKLGYWPDVQTWRRVPGHGNPAPGARADCQPGQRRCA